jgi:hypothetical protein
MTITTVDTAQRLIFPEDRTAFIYQSPGEPILTPFRSGLQVYLDQTAATLADIRMLNGDPISFSTIYTGDDSLLPLFLGPSSYVRELWIKVVGGTDQTYPLFAQYSDMLGLVPTLLHGNGPPTPSVGVSGCSYIDDQGLVLYGPKGANDWPSSGISLRGDQGLSGGDYIHSQLNADTIWIINHPLSFQPNVTVLDSAGTQVFGDVSYPLPGRIVIEFSSAMGGSALLS